MSKREEEKAKEVFLFFQSGSLRGSSVSGGPFRINDTQYPLGVTTQGIVPRKKIN